jgi:hypothetical protein
MRGVRRKRTFDLRRYDPLDARSRIQLVTALLDEEADRAAAVARDSMHYALFLSVTPGLTPESRTSMRETAFKRLQSCYNLEFPWLAADNPATAATTTSQSDVDALIAAWKKAFGDPNDPVVAKKIERTADALMRPVRLLKLRQGRTP